MQLPLMLLTHAFSLKILLLYCTSNESCQLHFFSRLCIHPHAVTVPTTHHHRLTSALPAGMGWPGREISRQQLSVVVVLFLRPDALFNANPLTVCVWADALYVPQARVRLCSSTGTGVLTQQRLCSTGSTRMGESMKQRHNILLEHHHGCVNTALARVC